ncbi:MAG: DUF6029 family protein [Bacteroidia bacterium]|nr:DUF6029 family protein [Bacteroidia bacterium]
MKHNFIFTIIFFVVTGTYAQTENQGQFHGNFQTDIQTYYKDTTIGANTVPAEKMLMNSYANFNYTNGPISAGVRFEACLNPLEGFSKNNNGVGFPHKYITYNKDDIEITAGSFYEQFGSGLILRSYEDKTVDIDNSLEGFSMKFSPVKGVLLKGVYGKQRSYFSDVNGNSQLITGPGIVRGFDGEINVNDIFPKLENKRTQVILGGSFVSKFQEDQNPSFVLPQNVGAWAGRININSGKVNFSAEYANKMNDPTADNNYIYKNGEALLLNISYSKKGLGAYLSAKRVDNMSFRSNRDATLNNLLLNVLPDITKEQTYTLNAMYPYATQPNGEVGFQADVSYKFKKESPVGGKYGTNISLNFSRVNSIDKQAINDTTAIGQKGTLGYSSDFFKIGNELYYQDINLEINKKLSEKLVVVLTYMDLFYNFNIIRGMTGHENVKANIGLADITYHINSKNTIRTEWQALFTKQDQGSWAMGLAEYSISPHWFFDAYDLYNYGNQDQKVHYFTAATVYVRGTNRFQLSYGKQRAGILCVGGVCRQVPASNGFAISVTSSF